MNLRVDPPWRMGQYLNMNVLDGFCAIQVPGRDGGVEQHLRDLRVVCQHAG